MINKFSSRSNWLEREAQAEASLEAARQNYLDSLGDCSVEDIREEFLKDFGNLGEEWCVAFLKGLTQAQLNWLRNALRRL